MADGSQHKVGRVRPPRVSITYDVEDGGAVQSRELPMVVGVVSDLSGDADDPLDYKERKFIEVEQGGVDRLMSRVGPKLEFTVPDKISGDEGKEVKVNLDFDSVDDFSPMGVASKIPQTAKLLEARQKLADLYGKVEANEKLNGILGEVLGDTDKREQLESQLNSLGNNDDDDKEEGS